MMDCIPQERVGAYYCEYFGGSPADAIPVFDWEWSKDIGFVERLSGGAIMFHCYDQVPRTYGYISVLVRFYREGEVSDEGRFPERFYDTVECGLDIPGPQFDWGDFIACVINPWCLFDPWHRQEVYEQ